jgi:hypothetical protein
MFFNDPLPAARKPMLSTFTSAQQLDKPSVGSLM